MSPPEGFDALEREVVDHVLALSPAAGVALGLHEYDGRLPELAREATARWAARAEELLRSVTSYDLAPLPADRRVDAFLLRLLLEAPLFDLRESREFDRNPMIYVGAVSLSPYITRPYAPAAQRIDAAVRALSGVPRLLADGRSRLDEALPVPFVDLAITMAKGLPAHFAEASEVAESAGVGPRFSAARSEAEAAVADFLAWLEGTARPRAVPGFALGARGYQRFLFVREGVEAPFAEIRAAGAADLARNQARLTTIAREAGVSVAALLDRMSRDHPAAAEMLATARASVEEAKAFVQAKRLASIPEPAVCEVKETPTWARALTTASMDSPGPFETQASEGIYYVTLVDPAWSSTQQEEWLRSLNRSMLRNVTVHEVFPGHYLQFLHFRAAPGSLARKVYASSSFVEGWAHYTEQLAIEAGLGGEGPLAEVAQLHDALLRDCRLLSSIGLHTDGWSVERATELFQREAHLERLPAEREAMRGTYDPGYFCYTLGKLAILDARRRLLSGQYGGDLRAFHDSVLGFGAPPVGLLEQLLSAGGARRP